MAVTTTHAMTGKREELHNVISNVDPHLTPFSSMIKKGKAKTTNPRWFTKGYKPADGDNKVVEGADANIKSKTQPVKIGNFTQIQDEGFSVSTTAQSIDKVGQHNELVEQTIEAGTQLRFDMEARAVRNYGSVEGDAVTARESASFEAYIVTNANRGATGASGGYSPATKLISAATDGTARPLVEGLVKDVLLKTAGSTDGKIEMISLGTSNKQSFSSIEGIAAQRVNSTSGAKKALTIIGAVDVYVSDFGSHAIVLNKQQRDESALFINKASWEQLILQPMKRDPLAKKGHSDENMIACEWTLKCTNEKANGIIADLTTQ